jgi:hypothetical protein
MNKLIILLFAFNLVSISCRKEDKLITVCQKKCNIPKPGTAACVAIPPDTFYYFDKSTKTCTYFMWVEGGCKPDYEIPFLTLEECIACDCKN